MTGKAEGRAASRRRAKPSDAPREVRWPAEWEPHAATWLAWPHQAETWPGHLADARREMAEIVGALANHEGVRLVVADDAMGEQAAGQLARCGVDASRVDFVRAPTDDAWLRDSGGVFVQRAGQRALVDFGFNAWGGKYPPWDRDQELPRIMAEHLSIPRVQADFVLEGGSIDGNGRGCVLTTEQCLLNPNREPGRTREQMEERLERWLGARQILWLGEGIEGDDTDGHVDDVARFVDPSTVVVAEEPDSADPNHAPLAENRRRLSRMSDADGKPLALASLPMPPVRRRGGIRLPESYANFYLANGVALVPQFGVASDERARAVLSELLPGRQVLGVSCNWLILGGGSVHCLSQQELA